MSRPTSPTQSEQSKQNMPPPPPPIQTGSTSSTVDSDDTDLDESYRDANAIEELQALGSSYAVCAAAVLKRWKEVTSNMTKIETLLINNAENKDFKSREYEAIYGRLTKQDEVLRKQLACFYPSRNPHIDQVVALIETQWHIPPSVLHEAFPGQMIFSRYNYCPPKTPLGKYRTSFPNQP
ncbi:hypothetical protein BGX26_007420 [Mortierella sp. AD094]|nr:hypothetical protein BGX26_007420 [Mortierella sp. AD094]